MENSSFENFEAFYRFYLAEHAQRGTKLLHLVGTTLGLSLGVFAFLTQSWVWAAGALVVGYAFAWFSHCFVEHNRPATFRHPWWSFLSDFRMAFEVITGKLPL